MKHIFEDKIPSKELFELRKSLEKLKEPDPSGMNSAIVDVD